jgi:hypothetical protein
MAVWRKREEENLPSQDELLLMAGDDPIEAMKAHFIDLARSPAYH